MLKYKKLELHNLKNNISTFKVGDYVLITGYVFTARDSAHKRISNEFSLSKKFPFDFTNQCIYYAGPTPLKNNKIQSCGPTTSGRMDVFTPFMLEHGIKCMIGKGKRNMDVVNAIKQHQALYIVTIGGAGAYLASKIKEVKTIAYDDLGCESIKKLYIENFPGIVAIDCLGNNIFQEDYNRQS